ncbi:DUF2971 domain-containing protein [Rhodococcus pyridinivorans]|uniref:DUF2971 domain-containing protein n=1 Tax=Rhodococcus pyridinivorans TaxID=103816 RepID=UPI001110AA19|nr:DUF2971 domain-containing protein [Rhodococcus pyridinivorans]MCD2139764.1 DUF2971 domain-containing protein [Rhodococcus pyridinivorans]
MNDALEYDFGLQIVSRSLNDALKRLEQAGSEKISSTIELKNSVQTVKEMLGGTVFNPKDGRYVCCFSRLHDDLGQWRGYANNGYCITFDRDFLTDSIAASLIDPRALDWGYVDYGGQNYSWSEKSYTDSALERMHDILHNPGSDLESYGFSESDPIFGELVQRNQREALAAIAGVAAVQSPIPFLKEACFVAESEMRVCISYPSSVKFRPSAIGPIPYSELEFDPRAIKAVTIGPGLNMDLRQATVAYMLSNKFGRDHQIELRKTRLSFRG